MSSAVSSSDSNAASPLASPVLSSVPVADPRLCIVAITKHGAAQAARLAADLPQAQVCTSAKFASAFAGLPNTVQAYEGALRDQIGPLFADQDQLIFFVSLGAVVRLIAPHLKDKDVDPGVIVVDDAGRYVIPVLSGHVGGANEWSERVADLLGAVPVLTTASDVGRTIPVDILGRHLGWRVEAPKINITRVSAHVVNGEPIAFVQDAGSRDWWTRPTPLPANIHRFDRFDEVDLSRFAAVLWVTHTPIEPAQWTQLHERLVVYRPPVEEAAAPAAGSAASVASAVTSPTARP
jgi:cobalt-precorrin 5A hydrolase